MATLPTKSFNQLVSDTAAGIQGRAAKLLNFKTGSSLLAITEGFSGLFLWFQALVLQLLQAMRLSTASGADVDTFTADFMPTIGISNGVSSPRLGAQASSGQVTYSRFTAGPSSCFIPVGATITTNDGNSTVFAVVANVSYPTYSPTPAPGGYTLPSSVASVVVPVQCLTPGLIGNVQAGTLSVGTTAIIGIDSVTNAAAFSNGADQEQDSALKKRFAAYILGLSRGDYFGLNASIEGAAVNVQWALTEDYNFDGSYHPGFFFVVADDGSGTPPQAFLDTVRAAAEAVRPLTVQCTVFAPTVILANASMQLTTALGYDHNTVVAQVAALIAFNINSLGLNNPLSTNQLAAWAYTVPGVLPGVGVSNVLLNGVAGDASTILTYKMSQDGTYRIGYVTIKAGIMIIS